MELCLLLIGKKYEVVIAMGEFSKVRQALEEHLNAINENSSEIQALLDYVQEVELKTDKLSQRIDQMQLNYDNSFEKKAVTPLNQVERKVFLVLYTEEEPLSFREISQRSEISISLVPECVSSLVQKGIPLHRSYANGHLFFKLNPEFKELQAKENVINLSLQSFME